MHLVPDELVQLVTASGTAYECVEKVKEYIAAGCTCPIMYSLHADARPMIDVFAEAFPREIEIGDWRSPISNLSNL